ncbi:hypothetical protein [Escherichia albertii]|uniref:hypothetical protein n=1 Tax=Escherichia albertii TaxID=208962 RepID=UPI0037BF92DA
MLVGSANINERSLLGDRDSELAVLISDTAGKYNDIDGSGILSGKDHVTLLFCTK